MGRPGRSHDRWRPRSSETSMIYLAPLAASPVTPNWNKGWKRESHTIAAGDFGAKLDISRASSRVEADVCKRFSWDPR
jgi:hypothetical protein